ncbi:hypothetical protein AMATHDRAFT_67425 [Amanita thiersii Skay4041]|uniref:Uncharacterized protein n=1 Tax=Amanita thiersii Skay4041 TaxID=703135 RepID=A0A2A9NIU6_9AGAR|nr:hypothetical protein AMATHDRAFT_67425 [Amanita thiersii Skay4041]
MFGYECTNEVVTLGQVTGPIPRNRAPLYTTLKIESCFPFHQQLWRMPMSFIRVQKLDALHNICRLGYTARCPNGRLFGSPALEGDRAQDILPRATDVFAALQLLVVQRFRLY